MSRTVSIGLELWTVRTSFNRDVYSTLEAVARLGYESVEFYSTYLDWTLDHANEVRAHLDRLGLSTASTHNGMRAFVPEAFEKTVALNHALGSALAVVASIPPVADLDGWRAASDQFADVAERLRPHGIAAGFHNHQKEWTPIDGERPMDIIRARTPQDFVLQLDVAPAVANGSDPVAWIHANPGRIKSVHCRDWSRTAGSNIAFGDGDCPWTAIVEAGPVGGVEWYLIEHGHAEPDEEFSMAARGIANLQRLLER